MYDAIRIQVPYKAGWLSTDQHFHIKHHKTDATRFSPLWQPLRRIHQRPYFFGLAIFGTVIRWFLNPNRNGALTLETQRFVIVAPSGRKVVIHGNSAIVTFFLDAYIWVALGKFDGDLKKRAKKVGIKLGYGLNHLVLFSAKSRHGEQNRIHVWYKNPRWNINKSLQHLYKTGSQ